MQDYKQYANSTDTEFKVIERKAHGSGDLLDAISPKERMLIAIQRGKADRVHVSPYLSNMIPCKLTGKSFWDIYLYNNPKKFYAYHEAVKYFGYDGWYWDKPHFICKFAPEAKSCVTQISSEQIIVKNTFITPQGVMAEEVVYPVQIHHR